MMTRAQFFLLKLSEECAEVSQRALKQIQFGKDEIQKDQPMTNEQRLRSELTDLIAVMRILIEQGELGKQDYALTNELVEKKRAKIEKYYDYSKSLGKVE
jgi:cell division protein FtsB